jgi:hypothetical protein
MPRRDAPPRDASLKYKHIDLPARSIDNADNSEPAGRGGCKFCTTRHRRGAAALPSDRVVGQPGGIALPPVLALDMHGLLAAVPVSRTFVYEEIKKGRLVARKLGRRTVFLIEDVRSWLHGFGGQDERR